MQERPLFASLNLVTLSTSIVDNICYSQLVLPISSVSLMVSNCLINKQVLAYLDKFWKTLIKYWFVCTANELLGQVKYWDEAIKGHMISVQHNCFIAQLSRWCSSFMFWVLKMDKTVDMDIWLCNFLKWSACLVLLFEMFIFHPFTHL